MKTEEYTVLDALNVKIVFFGKDLGRRAATNNYGDKNRESAAVVEMAI